ncbi:MAG: transporter suffix domain-containing protein [Desulfobaccales bacterium]
MFAAQEKDPVPAAAKLSWRSLSWRCRIGLFIIAVGDVILPALCLVLPYLDLPTAVKVGVATVLLVGGPEVLMLLGVALAGKEGYAVLKAALRKIWKRIRPPQRVSPARYRVGVIIFIASGLPMWVLAYLRAATALRLDSQVVLWVLIASDFAFLISFFIAGGEFWEKLKRLFTPEPVEQAP